MTYIGPWLLTGALAGDGADAQYAAQDSTGRRVVLRALGAGQFLASGGEARIRQLAATLGTLAWCRGIARILDVVSAGGETYAVVEPHSGPPLSALLEASTRPGRLGAWSGDPGTAAAVLLDVGDACLALRTAGLAHGALSPETVVVDGEGVAQVREPGLRIALVGAVPNPDWDAFAFGAIIGQVRAAWTAPGAPFGDALDRARQLAAPDPGTPNLELAVAEIRRAASALPAGWEQRPRLRRAVAAWTSTQPGPVAIAAPPTDALADPGATLVDLPPRDRQAPGATFADPPAGAPGATAIDAEPRYTFAMASAAATARPTPVPRPSAVPTSPLRIGSPPTAPRRPPPPAAAAAVATPPATSGPRPRHSRKRRLLTDLAIVLAAAVVALVVALLLRGRSSVESVQVLGAHVSTSAPTIGCGGQAVVAGFITTNGGDGTVEYAWSRSDGVATDGPHRQDVGADTTSIPVSFELTVTGTGSLREDITLTITSPARLGPYTTTVAYSCTGT